MKRIQTLTGPQKLDLSIKQGRKLASTKSKTVKDYWGGSGGTNE